MCLASGAAFGAMAVFGKLAYGEGVTVGTLLAVRFTIAAVLFWVLLLSSGGAREIRAVGRRDLRIGLALGACGYAVQAGCFFVALDRWDRELDRHRRERGDPSAAADRPAGVREVGLGAGGAFEQRLGVADEHEACVGQADAAPGALEQRDAGLALEQVQLLGHRGRCDLQRVGDRGDRPAFVELTQEAQAAQVKHGAS